MTLAITEQQRADLVPMLTGEVLHAFQEESQVSYLFTPSILQGTDTMIDRVVTQAKPVTIDWTERHKSAQQAAVGTITYELEKSGYLRHEEKNISKLIQDVDVLMEMAREHGTAVALLYDTVIFLQLLKASRAAAMTAAGGSVDADVDLDTVIQEGGVAGFDATNDELDVVEVVKKISLMITYQKQRRRLPKGDSFLLVSLGLYDVLLEDDKLVSTDFSSGNGDVSRNELRVIKNIPILPVDMFQYLNDGKAAAAVSSVSAATIDEQDKAARAILFSNQSIRVFEAMQPTFDMFYVEGDKMNYIDTQYFFNAGIRRQDHVAALYLFEVFNASPSADQIDSARINITATEVI